MIFSSILWSLLDSRSVSRYLNLFSMFSEAFLHVGEIDFSMKHIRCFTGCTSPIGYVRPPTRHAHDALYALPVHTMHFRLHWMIPVLHTITPNDPSSSHHHTEWRPGSHHFTLSDPVSFTLLTFVHTFSHTENNDIFSTMLRWTRSNIQGFWPNLNEFWCIWSLIRDSIPRFCISVLNYV